MYNVMTHYFNVKSRLYWLCHGSWCWVSELGWCNAFLRRQEVCLLILAFQTLKFCLTQTSSDFNSLFATIACLLNRSNIHRVFNCQASLFDLTTSRTDSPAVWRRKTTFKTRLTRQWCSISFSMFNPTLTSMRKSERGWRVHVETTASTQLSHIPMSRVCILSAHTYQFRQLNTIFKSIDFSSRRIWIMTTYQLRGFGALIWPRIMFT